MMELLATAAILSCMEYEQMLVALEGVELPALAKEEIRIELKNVTEPYCSEELET